MTGDWAGIAGASECPFGSSFGQGAVHHAEDVRQCYDCKLPLAELPHNTAYRHNRQFSTWKQLVICTIFARPIARRGRCRCLFGMPPDLCGRYLTLGLTKAVMTRPLPAGHRTEEGRSRRTAARSCPACPPQNGRDFLSAKTGDLPHLDQFQ
jgi:hypothetical protein